MGDGLDHAGAFQEVKLLLLYISLTCLMLEFTDQSVNIVCTFRQIANLSSQLVN